MSEGHEYETVFDVFRLNWIMLDAIVLICHHLAPLRSITLSVIRTLIHFLVG